MTAAVRRSAGGAPAIATFDLGRRYRRQWALRGCTLEVPAGKVVALVGPNGSGKTTLLHLIAGLTAPTTGRVEVLGHPAGGAPARAAVAFVAQDHPLYPDFTVAEMLRFGRGTNPTWDGALAGDRLAALDIPLDRRCGRLSGGQQAQVAITLALAKRPRVLLLDEPLANLDPLARDEVMRGLMAEVAGGELTVLLSSHVVSELREVCDHLVLLGAGRVRLAGAIADLVAEHRLLVGPRPDREREGGGDPAVPAAATRPGAAGSYEVVGTSLTGRQASYLVRGRPVTPDPRWAVQRVDLEQIVLGHMRAEQGGRAGTGAAAPATARPSLVAVPGIEREEDR